MTSKRFRDHGDAVQVYEVNDQSCRKIVGGKNYSKVDNVRPVR